jgi:molybdopterin molybdotransferase
VLVRRIVDDTVHQARRVDQCRNQTAPAPSRRAVRQRRTCLEERVEAEFRPRDGENIRGVELIDVATARERVLSAVRVLGPESVRIGEALGRVLREDVHSEEELPPFDSSAMDGFALVAGPARELPVVGESRAGRPSDRPLEPNQAMRISTGARVPEGADAVVPIERVEEGDGRVNVPETNQGANVRKAGEDVHEGELVLRSGTTLGPAELAVLASLGRPSVHCGPRPRVAVVVTGDELVEPGQPLSDGQIRDSNAIALAAQAERAGACVVARELVPDDREQIVGALGAALDLADVLCVSGGVSVGPHDHVKDALASLDVEERFWGVRLKPGKPTWFGTRDEKLAFGLPGNPVSAMVTFHLFARPALRALAGAAPDETRATAVLDAPIRRNEARDQVVRCRLEAREDGWHVAPTKEQGSHVLTSMLDADAFALVPAGEGELTPGDRVEVELLGFAHA